MNMAKMKNVCGFDCRETHLKAYCEVDGKEYSFSFRTEGNYTKRDFIFSVSSIVNLIPAPIGAIGISFKGVGTATKISKTCCAYLDGLDVSDFAHLGCEIFFVNAGNATVICGLYEHPEARTLIAVTNDAEIVCGSRIGRQLFTGNFGIIGEFPSNIVNNFGFLLTHVISTVNPDIIYLSDDTYYYTLKKYMSNPIVLSTKGEYINCIGAIEYVRNF